MIDIVKDYAAIGAGTAVVTGAGAIEVGRSRARAALAWGAATADEFQADPGAALAERSASVLATVHSGLDRVAHWMSLTAMAPAGVLQNPLSHVRWPHLPLRGLS